jgi:hypothetical protein
MEGVSIGQCDQPFRARGYFWTYWDPKYFQVRPNQIHVTSVFSLFI